MHSTDENKKLAKIVARAWMDPAYKSKLLTTAHEVFRAEGIDFPADVKIKVLADAPDHRHIVLSDSPLPSHGRVTELSDNADFYTISAYVYTKAAEDPEFKQRLMADPVGTIQQLGGKLPAGATISVYSETDSEIYFKLPLQPKARIDLDAGNAVLGISGDRPASGAMLLKKHPKDTVNVSVHVNVGQGVNVGAAVNVAVATNATTVVDVAAAAAVVVAAVVLI